MTSTKKLPRIAITMGDPAGVGPETIVSAWRESSLHELCRPLVVGHPEVMRRAVKLLAAGIEVIDADGPESVQPTPARMPCLFRGSDTAVDVAPAVASAAGGQAAYDAVVQAASLAQAGQVDGLTTAPLNKAALHAAGHRYPGHTELLANLCGVDNFAMMLHLPTGGRVLGTVGLNIVHVTLHCGLQQAINDLCTSGIVTKARLIHNVAGRLLKQSGNERPPRIAVCALNPHGGESGLFGNEESTIIARAVQESCAAGIDAKGPFPADTLIAQTADGLYDGVVAMYHDQGHIAVKLLDMHRAVNVTLGLPIIRTSVAHGTAFDLAWQGQAEWRGVLAAVRVCAIGGTRLTPRQ